MPRSGDVRIFGAAGDVVAHVLAHVAVPPSAAIVTRAASLYDARYVAWASDALPSGAVAQVVADAQLIGALLAHAAEGHLLQALLVAFEDRAQLGAALRAEAAAVGESLLDGGPDRAQAGAAVRRLTTDARELLEIVWAAIGLAWPSYDEPWGRLLRGQIGAACERVAGELETWASAIPVVANETVLLSHPLGPRARCFAESIVVGAPLPWNGLGPGDVAIRVGHESAVRCASDSLESRDAAAGTRAAGSAAARWAVVEDLALRGVERRLRGHALHDAHARFVASLDLSELGHADEALLAALLDRLDG